MSTGGTRRTATAILAIVGLAMSGSAFLARAGAHAANRGSSASSVQARTARASSGSAVIFDPANSWAVIVGISTYDRPTHPTYGGDGDASAFHQLLLQAGWADSHILLLTDQAATAGRIRSAMRWLVSNSNPTTFSVFHYSGHVQLQSGHTWLWGVDNQFISEDEFGSDLSGLAGHAWIDVAGCESAAFDHGLSSTLRFFTASSMANQKSYEEPNWGESVWTGFSVDQAMLQHKAGPGAISIQAAVRWSQPNAQQYTSNQQPYGPQTPYAVGGDGEWYLSPSVSPATSPPSAPPGGPSTTQPHSTTTQPPAGDPPHNGCTRVGPVAVKCNGGSQEH